MAKIYETKWVVFLASSILLNLFFILNLYLRQSPELTWSSEAAVEAEAVAALSCSGHGRAYLDGLVTEGNKPACFCNSCYGGPRCSQFSPDCPADVNSGDPLFLEPFWMQHARSSAVLMAGWHRMSYRMDDTGSSISVELTKIIFQLHAMVGNAVTEGRFIVFGTGSTQLLHAAVYALSQQGSTSPAHVVATIPFYPVYELQTELFNSVDFKFQGDTSLWKNSSSASTRNIIEFVTSPNNPDGRLTKPVLEGPSVKTIHDHAYHWPHFTAISAPADEDLMIFTISKLTGHAGSRFGWALIKDEAVYQRILTYLGLNTLGVSQDTQLRALKLLKVALRGGGREIFEFGYKTMRTRWERLNKILSASRRFSIQKLEPQYCSYFQKVTGPSPAYAWLKCEREEDIDCFAVLRNAGIIGRAGSLFNAESRYVRLSLIKSEDDFDLLLLRMDELVSKEEGAKII
ncbi:tryptophan aminotransferase-related protein 3-like [Macadamia integrifolia]|uniref:tryptophan aminotransferase-related protein 3-like n=1 Tax=Macadamia integrifolia TaxID=60698 RepID=UPI001C4FCFDE|nr:tryptophan aminotransferase-related protein 3-like [Macadamia integrifolia]